MALVLLSVVQRSPTRIRLQFDGAVGAGAFGPAALANYSAAESYNGTTTADRVWAVSGAILVASDATALELALSLPVSDGAWFWVQFNASVPAAAGPPFAGAVSQLIRTAEPLLDPSPEVAATDLDAFLWGEDFVFVQGDWAEGPEGDMLTGSGPQNAIDAAARRLLSEGLLWDDSYGLKPSRYIDAPAVVAGSIAGEAQAQIVQDDRVVAAQSSVGNVDPQHPDEVFINTTLTFFTGQSRALTTPLG
jgi:hypothetical protein